MKRLGVIDLYAAGPGLVLHSPSATAAFQPGENYMEALQLGPTAAALTLTGKVVCISSGSPGLDYHVGFTLGAPLPVTAQGALESARFGLLVTDGCVIVRDAYALLSWESDDYAVRRVAVPDGFYDGRVLRVRTVDEGRLHLDVYLVSATPRADCNGWVELLHEGP